MKHQHIYDLCKQHMHSYVLAETNDGTTFDGILTGLDEEYAYFAVPIDQGNSHMDQMHDYTYPHSMTGNVHDYNHQQGMYGNMPNHPHHHGHDHGYRGGPNEPYRFGYPGYGYGFPGYGFGYRPRRFSRLVLPLAALVALTAIPWY